MGIRHLIEEARGPVQGRAWHKARAMAAVAAMAEAAGYRTIYATGVRGVLVAVGAGAALHRMAAAVEQATGWRVLLAQPNNKELQVIADTTAAFGCYWYAITGKVVRCG